MSEHPPEASVNAAPRKGGIPWFVIVLILLIVVAAPVVVCGGLLAGTLVPALSQARESASMLRATIQGRTVGVALLQYEQSEGALPPMDADWVALLVDAQLIFPSDVELPEGPAGVQAFFYVPAADTSGGASQVLLYEHPDARMGGGIIVYADNSAMYIEDPEFTSIVDGLTLPVGTAWAPHKDVEWPADSP